jgi:hypothetical protein
MYQDTSKGINHEEEEFDCPDMTREMEKWYQKDFEVDVRWKEGWNLMYALIECMGLCDKYPDQEEVIILVIEEEEEEVSRGERDALQKEMEHVNDEVESEKSIFEVEMCLEDLSAVSRDEWSNLMLHR